jgi:hypothetical protein
MDVSLLSLFAWSNLNNPGYRNFPQGTIGDMIKDASQGISFVCNNIVGYGGDPNQ